MLKWLSLCVFGLSLTAFAGGHGTTWIPHLSANEQFKSTIFLRNDSFDAPLTVTATFFASDGTAPAVSLSDSNGPQSGVSEWSATLAPQTARVIELDSVTGGDDRSVQARITGVDGAGNESELLAIEAAFALFDGTNVVSKVGVAVSDPSTFFKVNLNGAELRGFGVTNTDAAQACDCTFTMVGGEGQQLATAIVSIPAQGKWLGVVEDLFPNVGELLGSDLGHMSALCSESVSVQALAFNEGVMSGVPATGFQFDP